MRVPRSADQIECFEARYRHSLPGVVAEILRFPGEKLLAFCRTRSDVEELAHALSGIAARVQGPCSQAAMRSR